MSVSLALLALAGMISGLTAATVVPRSQYESQDFEANEAAINRQFQSSEAATARQFNSNEAALAREFSSQEALKQRMFEQEMSSTQYQRAVQDLKAAGLNPASIGLGLNGASTPVGSSASVVGASGASVPGGSVGRSGIANTSYFANMFNSAANMAMAKDKNFLNKTIAEMYTNNAREMNDVTNLTKREMAQLRADTYKEGLKETFKNKKALQKAADETRRALAETHTRTRSFYQNGMYNTFTDKFVK